MASFLPPPDFLTRAVPAAAGIESPQITMLSPVDREKILIDSSLPMDQRRVALRARMLSLSDDPQLWWMIDGECVGVCRGGEVVWWDPAAGSHEVRVITSAGQGATARVEVVR